METLKNLLGVAVYVMLSCVTVSIIFGGVRNIYYAWKTRKWKNIAFTLIVCCGGLFLVELVRTWSDLLGCVAKR